jgi:nitrogen fixation protein NifU and related proteins
MLYSAAVLDHFRQPRCAGGMEGSSSIGEVTNPVCGDVLKLWIKTEECRITAASFKAAGCVPAIACGSWLADWLSEGRTVGEALALAPQDIESALDGLPEASKHAAQLAIDVLRKTIESPAKRRLPVAD